MAEKLSVRAVIFDAYGTLFDVGSAAAACRDVLGDHAAPLAAMWRDKQLQYTWLRGLQGRHAEFETVTRDALSFCLQAMQLERPGLADRLMRVYRTLSSFPEVAETLQSLRAQGFTTAILSNGTPELLADAIAGSKLDGLFDHVLSVEEVGVFKPHPSVYQLAVDRLNVSVDDIAFLSSNGWDAYAASAFGFRVIWCNRYGQPAEHLPGNPDFEITTLDALLELVAFKSEA